VSCTREAHRCKSVLGEARHDRHDERVQRRVHEESEQERTYRVPALLPPCSQYRRVSRLNCEMPARDIAAERRNVYGNTETYYHK
jgi:hypothetical protein